MKLKKSKLKELSFKDLNKVRGAMKGPGTEGVTATTDMFEPPTVE
ncbi:hypothetical protein [Pseudoalteromonas luteoviolacea]|uniref:Uncharacterized protein n=1 Tax=Pseudoalteromonas luteoviolacea DSM 6061 TaxID=1365250 RepID=A0A166V6E2_9GAMM|nr:hypothetical protein [Pseudoalteromonas luteoviolacea]KZN31770.1 hypothetical protein N475_04745 [Pseudoalteromonas luteoviolacea DSM 6061]KZN54630.1 hypothetical protein N474_02565 [Pseudoalteromonas luteoviolacea CPMOR-2]MBE0389107.1 hypothetical protein [Pseudoalteromonas luteoviolacea DSM 6061]